MDSVNGIRPVGVHLPNAGFHAAGSRLWRSYLRSNCHQLDWRSVPARPPLQALGLVYAGRSHWRGTELFLSGPIAQRYGWRMAMIFAALPALLLIPMLLALRE